MSTSDDIPRLERPAFFKNQHLTAADLTAAQTYNGELRCLHNRSLHSWGIAFGFAVSGRRGAQSVKVDSGYAIDCNGRDLVLDEARDMPIPAVAGASDGSPASYYLTISYAEDTELNAIMRAGACNFSGAVRRQEMPVVRWQDPADSNAASRYRHGQDVVLCAIRVSNCQLVEDVSARERRDAVPVQQPYVAVGQSEPGETRWRLFKPHDTVLGVVTTVATSDAGFQFNPRYQAHVVGERIFTPKPPKKKFAVDGYAQIAKSSATSFELQVTLPTGTTLAGDAVVLLNPPEVFEPKFVDVLKLDLGWHVVWMGVEG
jgi:hypothetical protein